jgi:hypothetical protein
MKNTYKIGAFFVMSILASAISAQTVYDSKTLVDTNSASTSTSTVNSNNANNNNNVNINTTTVDSKSVNVNTNINDSKSVSTNTNYQFGTMTNNNNNVSTSTATSDNKNLNVNDSKSVSDNKNLNVNTSTSVSDNKNLNVNTSTSVSDNKNVNVSTSVSDSKQIIDSSNLNTNINKSEITQKVIQPPPTAVAPTMMSGGNSDLCTTGVSGAVQTQIFGVSGGGTTRDLNCERLKLSKTLYDMGMKVAAVATMCQDRRVFDAMLAAGTPCPYEGKIGEQAKAAWESNPDKIPVFEDHKKDKQNAAKNIGLGAIGAYLLHRIF